MSTDPAPKVQAAARAPIPAAARFILAVVLIAIVNLFVQGLCFSLLGDHVVVADTLYRWLGSVLLVAGFLFFSRVLDQVTEDEFRYIGLPKVQGAVRQSVLGVVLGAALITIAVVAIAIAGRLDLHAELTSRTAVRGGLVTLLLLGGAMLEELMFRGYPFQRLIEAVGAPIAILLLSIFFGAVHLGNPNAGGYWSWGFLNTLAVGVLFAVAYLRAKTLWFPFGIHFGWNFFLGIVYGLPVSGIKDFSVIVRSGAHGSKLLTGGAYGIEASLTGSIVILIGLIMVALLPERYLTPGMNPRPVNPESI